MDFTKEQLSEMTEAGVTEQQMKELRLKVKEINKTQQHIQLNAVCSELQGIRKEMKTHNSLFEEFIDVFNRTSFTD